MSMMSDIDSPVGSTVDSEVPTEPLPPTDQQLVREYMSQRSTFLSDFQMYEPVQNMRMLAHHVFEVKNNVRGLKDEVTGSRRLLGIVSANQREGNESIMAVGQDLGRVEEKVDRNHIVLRNDMIRLDDKLDGSHTALKGDISRLDQKVDGNHNVLKGNHNILKGDIFRLDQKVDGNHQVLQGGIARLDQALKGDISRLDTKVDGNHEAIFRLDANVDANHTMIRNDVNGLRAELNSLRSEIHTIRQETQQGFMELKQMLTLLVSARG